MVMLAIAPPLMVAVAVAPLPPPPTRITAAVPPYPDPPAVTEIAEILASTFALGVTASVPPPLKLRLGKLVYPLPEMLKLTPVISDPAWSVPPLRVMLLD